MYGVDSSGIVIGDIVILFGIWSFVGVTFVISIGARYA